jgi:hypothetical protein
MKTSVADPEPVEQEIFAGAEAKVFWPYSGFGAGYVNFYKIIQKPKIFHTKVCSCFKNHNFVAIYFKEPF